MQEGHGKRSEWLHTHFWRLVNAYAIVKCLIQAVEKLYKEAVAKQPQGWHEENPPLVPAERMFGGEQETKGFV